MKSRGLLATGVALALWVLPRLLELVGAAPQLPTGPGLPTNSTSTNTTTTGAPSTISPELEQARDAIIAVLDAFVKENLDESFKILNALREFRRHV